METTSQLGKEPIHQKPHSPLHLFWIYHQHLDSILDAATWLETTRELRDLGWKVTLVAPGRTGSQRIQGVEVQSISTPNNYLFRWILFHLKALKSIIQQRETIDVVLFHEMSAPWVLPLRVLRRLTGRSRPAVIMDTRTLYMGAGAGETRKAWLVGACLPGIDRLGNKWTDGRTAITDRIAEDLRIPSVKLWGVWPSGANLEEFTAAREERRWPLPGEPIQMVYVGALDHGRNLMALCEGIERANSLGCAFSLKLIGNGRQRADLENFAQRTAGRVRVLPPVPHGQIPHILGCSHVGALPFPDEARFRVSSPIKLFEYLAAGLPIFATRIACHTDAVRNANCAVWADNPTPDGFATTLTRLWAASASLPQMGSVATETAQAWTWRASASKLSEALKKGLASR